MSSCKHPYSPAASLCPQLHHHMFLQAREAAHQHWPGKFLRCSSKSHRTLLPGLYLCHQAPPQLCHSTTTHWHKPKPVPVSWGKAQGGEGPASMCFLWSLPPFQKGHLKLLLIPHNTKGQGIASTAKNTKWQPIHLSKFLLLMEMLMNLAENYLWIMSISEVVVFTIISLNYLWHLPYNLGPPMTLRNKHWIFFKENVLSNRIECCTFLLLHPDLWSNQPSAHRVGITFKCLCVGSAHP